MTCSQKNLPMPGVSRMDPLHFCISIVPVTVYLLLVGWINLTPRPFLTTGTRDFCALALAVSGFVMAGPMELFLPEAVASVFRGWVWVPLIVLYGLLVTLAALMMRPRLVIYNLAPNQLNPLLSEVVGELDATTRWAGDSVVMPGLGVQFAIESYPGMRNISLVAIGPEQNMAGWKQLGQRLRSQLTQGTYSVNTQGFSFLFLAIILAAAIAYSLFTGKQEIAQQVKQMLRM